MLDFVVQYQAINNITGDKAANLCAYKLDDSEWKIAEQLRNTMKVHC
jgi:hypothetical protein